MQKRPHCSGSEQKCVHKKMDASNTPVEAWSQPWSLLRTALWVFFFSFLLFSLHTCHVPVAFFFCHSKIKQTSSDCLSRCSFSISVILFLSICGPSGVMQSYMYFIHSHALCCCSLQSRPRVFVALLGWFVLLCLCVSLESKRVV